jgi:hypothetical protein
MVKRKVKSLTKYKSIPLFGSMPKALNQSCLTLLDRHQYVALASLLQKATTKAKIRT